MKFIKILQFKMIKNILYNPIFFWYIHCIYLHEYIKIFRKKKIKTASFFKASQRNHLSGYCLLFQNPITLDTLADVVIGGGEDDFVVCCCC